MEKKGYANNALGSSVLELANTMYVLLNKRFEIVYINTAAVKASEALLGNTPQVGNYVLDYVVEDRKASLLKDLKKAALGEPIDKHESILTDTNEGAVRFFSYHIQALGHDSDLLLIESVSYRVFDDMQLQIKERHEYLDSIINTIGTGIKISDAEGVILEINETYQRFLGFTAKELLGRNITDCLIAEERELAIVQLTRFLKEGVLPNRFWQLQHKNGTVINCDIAIEKVLLKEGLRVIYAVTDITFQQKLEQSLRQTNAQTGALINNLALMLWSVDDQIRFITANQSAKDYFKTHLQYSFQEGDALTKIFSQLNPEWPENLMQRYQEVLKTGKPQQFGVLERYTGSLRHFTGEMHPIIEQEQVHGVSCFMEDDTDVFLRDTFSKGLSRFIVNCTKAQKVSDVFLHLVEDLLRQLFIEEGEILVLENDLLYPVVTYRHGEVKHTTTEEAPFELPIGKGVVGICASEKRTLVINDSKNDMRVLTVGQAFLSEIAVPIYVHGEVFGVINCESSSKGFFKPIFQEILEDASKEAGEQIRKLIDEHKIRKMERMQSAILNSTPIGYMLIDENFKMQSFNKMAERMMEGYRQAKPYVGQVYLDYVPKEDYRNFRLATKKAFAGELVKVERNLADHPLFGNQVWILLSFAPAYSADNEIFGVTLIIEDITDAKKKEKLILQRNYELKKANRELDDFVYSISHDVRAPLSSIDGLSGLIRQSKDLDEVMEFNDYIKESVKRLDTFIHNILNFSRNKRMPSKPEMVFLPEIVKDVIHGNRFLAHYEHILFKQNVPEKTIFFDPFRLRLILDIIISNAIKFQDKKRAEKVITVTIDIEDHKLYIFVKDNGQGITKRQRERIFDMFYTANKHVRGNGVGLYILKEAVDFLKGNVKVNSKFGQGTEIQITLPIPEYADTISG